MELGETVGRRHGAGTGEANPDERIRSDYTVMDETIAAVNTSRQGSMRLSSLLNAALIRPGLGLPRRNFCLTGAAQPGNHASLCRVAPFMIWGVTGTQLGMFHEHEPLPPHQHLHTWD